jgi:2-dehydropantoate 2-reductase
MAESASETVAVIGSGGIGGFLAASLVGAGRDVTLCVRTPFERLTIESGGETREVPVRVATDPGDVKPVRWILLTTKAQDTAGAGPWIEALSRPDTVLVVVQNGVGHVERATPIAAGAEILPAIIWCSVERTSPGHIVHHGAQRIAVPAGATGEAFARLFAGTGFKIEETDDFVTVAWRKLVSNLVANAVTALTIRRMGVFEQPMILAMARKILAEAVEVAQAEGAKLTGEDSDRAYKTLGGHGPNAGTSMLYDRLAGRPLEHRHLTGALIEAADRHGIEAPVNRTLYALLEAVSGQKLAEVG